LRKESRVFGNPCSFLVSVLQLYTLVSLGGDHSDFSLDFILEFIFLQLSFFSVVVDFLCVEAGIFIGDEFTFEGKFPYHCWDHSYQGAYYFTTGLFISLLGAISEARTEFG
jgi:hypothetical protein